MLHAILGQLECPLSSLNKKQVEETITFSDVADLSPDRRENEMFSNLE